MSQDELEAEIIERDEIVMMDRDALIDTGHAGETGYAGIGVDTRDEYDFVPTADACNSVLRHFGHEELTEEEEAQFRCNRCGLGLFNFVHNCSSSNHPEVYGCRKCDDVCGLCVPPVPE